MATAKNWLAFFKQAELSTGVAQRYAMICTNHQVKREEISEETLKKVGITSSEDVKSILRHANACRGMIAKENANEVVKSYCKTKGKPLMVKPLMAKPVNAEKQTHVFSKDSANVEPAGDRKKNLELKAEPSPVPRKKLRRSISMGNVVPPKMTRLETIDKTTDLILSSKLMSAQKKTALSWMTTPKTEDKTNKQAIFKATPVNKNLFKTSGSQGVPMIRSVKKTTKPKPFVFESDRRKEKKNIESKQ